MEALCKVTSISLYLRGRGVITRWANFRRFLGSLGNDGLAFFLWVGMVFVHVFRNYG